MNHMVVGRRLARGIGAVALLFWGIAQQVYEGVNILISLEMAFSKGF
jgi:hypothetical protein